MIGFENMTVQQRVEQFDTKHGTNFVLSRGWVIFEDGAMREQNPLGALCEPPTDFRERLRTQIWYCEEQLRRATSRFTEAKRELVAKAMCNLREQFSASPPPCQPSEAVKKLHALRANVRVWQLRLEDMRQQLVEEKPEYLRVREENTRVNLEANAQFLAAVNDIEV